MPDRLRWPILLMLLIPLAVLALSGKAEELQMNQQTTPFNGQSCQPLALAVATGDTARIAALATPEALGERGEQGITLLQWAILRQQPGSVQALLDAGADVTETGMDGNSALHIAAMVEDAGYLTQLLARQPVVDVRNAVSGATPLAAAVLAGRPTQVRQLLDAAADSRLADRVGDTPLHIAARINAPQVALMLLQNGADAAAVNRQGMTFQAYFAQTPRHLQNEAMRQARQQLDDWLQAHRLAARYRVL
ncbi:ankyrin repeat domain-containing protein [Serratia rhizosphaerae]|uniref:ankyrin repeat domain-containing protein n=1 Tax=unclassified Serratia (in: enterobacteria) TaxID=2647522 RepID=UPI000CF702AE|nr:MULTISPECIES: ankyrin repeat domain-containing protein [unclassified Serratia (in: enterobacteria)]MBU3891724.1 ankyrin repeat domain-containing protein [Serratia rubidaea]AVJ18901.1 protein PhlB [Serratia sp. MYb239]MCA4825212.1 ankyrin repeat domain-containing protein [Serratia rubidaea]QNK33593.1 ankyrin repeat domain-containing protein [Serratia sp. JUb9]QPT12459.1 ankyrin repeat domain-containing protein [Serratia rubidaea]